MLILCNFNKTAAVMLLYILQYAILEYNILTLKLFRQSYSDRLVVLKIHFFIGDVAVLPIKCDSSGILLERPNENFGVSMRNGIFFGIIEQFAAYSPALCVFGDIQPPYLKRVRKVGLVSFTEGYHSDNSAVLFAYSFCQPPRCEVRSKLARTLRTALVIQQKRVDKSVIYTAPVPVDNITDGVMVAFFKLTYHLNRYLNHRPFVFPTVNSRPLRYSNLPASVVNSNFSLYEHNA